MTYVDYSKTKYCRRCDIRVDKSKSRCPWCNGALAYRPLVNRRLNGQKRTDKHKAVKVEGGNPDALGVVRDLRFVEHFQLSVGVAGFHYLPRTKTRVVVERA